MVINKESGFSLVEAVTVILVGMILAAFAIPTLTGTIQQSNADSAAQLIVQELNYARTVAVGSQVAVEVQFPSADQIVVSSGTGEERGPFVLPNGMSIQTSAFSPDTPDGLGGILLGVLNNTKMSFLDNGSVVDSPTNNNLRSGTFFLQHNNGDPATRRAVTLIGGTGLTHVWRYDASNNSWK
jgi:Tfp pilus assembly protein FimT